jgi:hypothetical protein
MEFAEWVVSGLDQLRLGRLPAGTGFYEAVSAGLGNDPRLAGYMNSGDPAARAEVVQLIAAAVAANPGFEQHLRAAAAAAAQGQGQGAVGGKPPFFKTGTGVLVIVAAAVVVVGGGLGLALGLGGSGGGDLAGMLKGTWTCHASGAGADEAGGKPLSFTVGDGTWSAGSASGTWKQNGSTATLHDNGESDDIKATGLPSGGGSFDVAVGSSRSQLVSVHVKGTLSAHKLTVAVPGDSGDLNLVCTK